MSSRFRDLFDFSRSERIGIAALSFLIGFLSVTLIFIEDIYDYFIPPKDYTVKADSVLAVIRAEEREMKRRDSLRKERDRRRYRENRYGSDRKKKAERRETEQLNFKFNPNTLGRDSLILLGFKPFVAENIIKYRKAGGGFDDPEDMFRIYEIDEDRVSELIPYIDTGKSEEKNEAEKGGDDSGSIREKTYEKCEFEVLNIDLNTADSIELREIYGIGAYYSRGIVNYRELLGGYVNAEQLKEVYGFNDSLYGAVESNVYVDESFEPKKININELNAYEMSRHPYIKRQVAVAIERHRRESGLYFSPDELVKMRLLTEVEYLKIAPYLIADPIDEE